MGACDCRSRPCRLNVQPSYAHFGEVVEIPRKIAWQRMMGNMTMNQMCPVCRGRRTDGNGRTCQRCEGIGELKPPSDPRDHEAYVPFRASTLKPRGKLDA